MMRLKSCVVKPRLAGLAVVPAGILATIFATIFVAIFVLGVGPARAAVCLGKSMNLDEIIETIGAAPGCDGAMKVFKACELGSSGDISLGAAVEKKCERGFFPRLAQSQKLLYRREMQVCDDTYQNDEGTMYRSLTAGCRAEVSQRYAHRTIKAAARLPAR